MRFAYGISEKQLRKYVHIANTKKDPAQALYIGLETRLDNTVYRMGFAPTRRSARQMVSHGHITVNGKKMTVPSHAISKGDVIAVREGSVGKTLFVANQDTISSHTAPNWLTVNSKKLTATVKGTPEMSAGESLFDLPAVFEFYSR